MQTIYHIALVTHIIGLTMMAGTTLVDAVLFKQFGKQYAKDQPKALAVREAMSRFSMLFGIGIVLLVTSGVGMMAITNGAFGEQVWFRIKFGLVVLTIINGLAVGRRQGLKLNRILTGGNVEAELLKVKNNISLFHIAQLTCFTIIFVLSVFKFN